jgi:FkbH-like protein
MKTNFNQDLLAAIRRVSEKPTYINYNILANFSEEAEQLGLETCRIGILRNFTIEPAIPVLKGEVIRLGLAPDVFVADFDSIAESVFNSSSQFYVHKPQIILLALWLEGLSHKLICSFLTLTNEEVEAEIVRIIDTMKSWFQAIRTNSSAPILVNNFPLPNFITLGILDYQFDNYQIHTLLRLNSLLLRESKNFKDIYWVNTLGLFANIGYDTAVDQRCWETARAPLSKYALVPFGVEYGKFIRALRGKTRKCLVLDCDNTLWGGIIGEDGLKGIKLSSIYPGSAFIAFQEECLNLYNRGIILALCSKNNEIDVLEILNKHPDCILKEHHFSTWQINWDDKATNLIRIAESLNIGLDSLVFIDDSLFECDWVRTQLPQVEVIHLGKEVANYSKELVSHGFFDSLAFSGEDKKRSQMYVGEHKRKKILESASSFEEYLSGLELCAKIGFPLSGDIPRISQLTQKTNQFSMTTRRYTEGDIENFLKKDDADVLYLKLSDKVSELGLIAVAIVEYKNSAAEIDSFMMSCRALGRGAEDVVMGAIYKLALSRDCNKLLGIYIPSKKNMQVADFYLKRGFNLVEDKPERQVWERELSDQMLKNYPKWIAVEETNFLEN